MKYIARSAGCIIRWGGGGGAILGALIVAIYLIIAVVSDVMRTGGLPYYDFGSTITYTLVALLLGAICGLIVGIVAGLMNGIALAILIAVLRFRTKIDNVTINVVCLTFALVSGLGIFVFLATQPEVSGTSTNANIFLHPGWLLGAVIPAVLAASWGWIAGSKASLVLFER